MTPHDRSVDQMVDLLNPAREEDVAHLIRPGAAKMLLDDVGLDRGSIRPKTATDPVVVLPPRRRKPVLVGLAAAFAALLVLAAGAYLRPSPATAEPVAFSARDGYVTARVTDPTASKDRFEESFAAHGFDIQVTLVPASPSGVGTIVAVGEDEQAQGNPIETIYDDSCVTEGGAGADFPTCPVGVQIPDDFEGKASLSIGRPAESGELYASTTNAFFPGEALHCSGLLGTGVEEAVAGVEELGLRPILRTRSSTDDVAGVDPSLVAGQLVIDATPRSDEELFLWVAPDLEMIIPGVWTIMEELAERGC